MVFVIHKPVAPHIGGILSDLQKTDREKNESPVNMPLPAASNMIVIFPEILSRFSLTSERSNESSYR